MNEAAQIACGHLRGQESDSCRDQRVLDGGWYSADSAWRKQYLNPRVPFTCQGSKVLRKSSPSLTTKTTQLQYSHTQPDGWRIELSSTRWCTVGIFAKASCQLYLSSMRGNLDSR